MPCDACKWGHQTAALVLVSLELLWPFIPSHRDLLHSIQAGLLCQRTAQPAVLQ